MNLNKSICFDAHMCCWNGSMQNNLTKHTQALPWKYFGCSPKIIKSLCITPGFWITKTNERLWN